jgi:hypothetical protein
MKDWKKDQEDMEEVRADRENIRKREDPLIAQLLLLIRGKSMRR